jgi:hypothetical protein
MSNETTDRRQLAEVLHTAYDRNDWGGSASVEDLAAAKYAVIVEREDDGWILAAGSRAEVAAIYRETLSADYAEWIDQVVRMSDGESVPFEARVTVEIRLDGGVGTASDEIAPTADALGLSS